jgi:acetoin utilization deacetylase AcuC-like enzyme
VRNADTPAATAQAAFDLVLLPVISAFDPDMVVVSAGFDAAEGDYLGGCHVSPVGVDADVGQA